MCIPSKQVLIRLALAVSALTLCVAVPACFGTDRNSAGPPEKVTIAYATPPYTLLADIAQARGYFRQEGLEVKPLFHSTGKAALDDVLQGKAEFATVADTPVMFAVMRGAPIAIIATIQTSNKTNAIFARKDRGILTPGDLKKKRIGVTYGGIGEFFTDTFLAAHGIAGGDARLIDMKPEEMSEALANGDVDAISAWPPYLNQAQKKLAGRGIMFYDEDIYTQTFNVAASREFIRNNPGAVRKVLRGLIRAEEFFGQNPAEALRSVAGFRKMDEALVGEISAGNAFSVTLDQLLLLALEDESRWAIRHGLTRRTEVPNYLDLLYLDGLASIRPKAVNILR